MKCDASVIQRFEEKYEVANSGCWIWTAGTDSSGYGAMFVDGKKVGAHRISFEIHVGPIPSGKQLDHLCRIRRCVNPKHLECVTQRENCLRGVSFSAVNARKTHCPHGHPFSEENTYVLPNGARGCRTCRKASHRRANVKRKAARRLESA